jgi:hypothetical protein
VTWSIGGDVMVEFVPADHDPDRLVAHELSLLRPVRKALRTRHLTIEYASPSPSPSPSASPLAASPRSLAHRRRWAGLSTPPGLACHHAPTGVAGYGGRRALTSIKALIIIRM